LDNPKTEKEVSAKPNPAWTSRKPKRKFRQSRTQRGQAESLKGSFGKAEHSSDKPKAEKGLRHSRIQLGQAEDVEHMERRKLGGMNVDGVSQHSE